MAQTNHSYAGQESIAVFPERYLERTSDQRLLEITAAQLQLGNRSDIWFKGNASGNFTFVNITVVVIDAP